MFYDDLEQAPRIEGDSEDGAAEFRSRQVVYDDPSDQNVQPYYYHRFNAANPSSAYVPGAEQQLMAEAMQDQVSPQQLELPHTTGEDYLKPERRTIEWEPHEQQLLGHQRDNPFRRLVQDAPEHTDLSTE